MSARIRTYRNSHKNALTLLSQLIEWGGKDSIEFNLRKMWNMRITVDDAARTIDISTLTVNDTWQPVLIWRLDPRGKSTMGLNADLNGINQAMTKLVKAILFNVQHNGSVFILSNKEETKQGSRGASVKYAGLTQCIINAVTNTFTTKGK